MVLDHAACHLAVRSRDVRFDGAFFTGVKTTGIYCRPVCPAKTPLSRNCEFFASAAAAEASGYRPCLRCRPESAPNVRHAGGLAARFLADVERDGLFGETLADAAARLGVSTRHLRRVVEQECGLAPVELIAAARSRFARRLLVETRLPVAEIAFAAGFGSIARFNASFRSRYGVPPSALRRGAAGSSLPGLHLLLPYRAPFAWDALLDYWRLRAIPGVECVAQGCYRRAVSLDGHHGWLTVSLAGGAVDLEISESLAPVLIAVAGRVRAMLDLDADPAPIAAKLAEDPLLAPLVERTPGLRVPGAFDGFEVIVRAILGQQVTVRAASTIAGRLVERFAQPAEGLPAGLTHFPLRAGTLAALDAPAIAAAGIPLARAETIVTVARAAASGEIDCVHPEPRTLERLRAIRGVGPWTCDYLAIRLLNWPDAFPAGDLGLRKAVSPDSPVTRSESWRPWRAYAALYLWTSTTTKSPRPSAH